MVTKETSIECIICKQGHLVELIESKFVSFGPPIIGPGSKDQYQDVSAGFYCDQCGIKYQILPKVTP